MKKLFISVPMKGRTDEDINKSMGRMWGIAEALADEDLEPIHTFISEEPPEGVNVPVWYLGKSIEKLAEADCFIGVNESWHFSGCQIEREVADFYKIKKWFVNLEDVAPDAWEKLREEEEKWNVGVPKKC